MAILLITVVYNREDASEVVDVRTEPVPPWKDALKSGQAIKQAFDFAKTRDPIQLLMQPAQKGKFISDVEKSTLLTDEEKKRFVGILLNSGPLDVATFGIGDKPAPMIAPPLADAPPPLPQLITILLDP